MAYVPPIGIPAPDFGIDESHWEYSDVSYTYDYGSGLEAYRTNNDGPYTHYVDMDHGSATNTANPLGSPTTPRLTVPTDLPAGSVVEIHNGTYTGGTQTFSSSDATAALPTFIRGISSAKPVVTRQWNVLGKYIIFENIDFDKSDTSETPAIYIQSTTATTNKVHHVSIRKCEVHNYPDSGAFNTMIAMFHQAGSTGTIHDIVIYSDYIHHNGVAIGVQRDVHGVSCGRDTQYVWVLDNRMSNHGGDSIQYKGGSDPPRWLYIGRNDMSADNENAIDLKGCRDVIISQNTIHRYHGESSGSTGDGIAIHYGPGDHAERVWVIFNRVSDCSTYGVVTSGGADDIYILGNEFYDCGAAMVSWQSLHQHVYNNTVHDCTSGLSYTGTGGGSSAWVKIHNNIFSERKVAGSGNDISLASNSAFLSASTLSHNLCYHSGGSARINWGGSVYDVAGFLSAQPTKSVGFLEVDPLFVDGPNNDFGLQTGSPAINAGSSDFQDMVDLFQSLYGINIGVDINNVSRPQGTVMDMGANESGLAEIHRQGLRYMMQVVLSEEDTVPVNFYVGLATDASLVESAVVSDLAEVTGTGYSRQAVASSDVGFTGSDFTTTWGMRLDSVSFTASAADWDAAKLAFLSTSDVAGLLIASMPMSTIVTVGNAETMTVSMGIKL